MSTVLGADATWANYGHLPAGVQKATYSTQAHPGDGIAAPRAWLNTHPEVLQICQDPGLSDDLADYGDIEWQAGLISAAPGFITRARAAWHAAKRPGQRWPGLYVSASQLTPLVNALVAAHITDPVPIILAKWNIGQAAAVAAVQAAWGPFPLDGVQYADTGGGGLFDWDEYSAAWLATGSRKPAPPAPHGPFRHVADGKQSLVQIAAGRGTTFAHLVQESVPAYTAALGRVPLEAGTWWWSTHS
jgi:hypothetical protein